MTRLLVTGFEPFGEHATNPSALLAKSFDGVVLPVSYARAADALSAAIDDRDPELVVCFGLADGDTAISVERFAHNLEEADIIDNDGARGSGAEIDPAGPLALRSTLPVDEIVAALRDDGIPAVVSRDAGGYLCNHIFYVLMRTLDPNRIGGFVHVPPASVLPPDDLVRAAGVIVATCKRHMSSS
jgi:pyroglutamyl-peptidase